MIMKIVIKQIKYFTGPFSQGLDFLPTFSNNRNAIHRGFNNIRSLAVICILAVSILAGNIKSVYAAESTLYSAAESALTQYKQTYKHSLDKHGFKVSRATRVTQCNNGLCKPNEAGTVKRVTGRLVHTLNWASDDKVTYTIEYDEQGVPKFDININRGGVAAWFDWIDTLIFIDFKEISFMGTKLGVTSPFAAFRDASTKLSKLVKSGGWEAQAGALIHAIALYGMSPYPDGSLLIEDRGNGGIYIAQGGAVFPIPSARQYNLMGLRWGYARILKLNSIKTLPQIPRDDTLLREVSSPAVFIMKNGKKHWVVSEEVFYGSGFKFEDVRIVPDGGLAYVTTGPNFLGN